MEGVFSLGAHHNLIRTKIGTARFLIRHHAYTGKSSPFSLVDAAGDFKTTRSDITRFVYGKKPNIFGLRNSGGMVSYRFSAKP